MTDTRFTQLQKVALRMHNVSSTSLPNCSIEKLPATCRHPRRDAEGHSQDSQLSERHQWYITSAQGKDSSRRWLWDRYSVPLCSSGKLCTYGRWYVHQLGNEILQLAASAQRYCHAFILY